LPSFLRGDFDGVVYNTQNPKIKGIYWAFIKEMDAEREAARLDHDAKVCQEQIDTANAEAFRLRSEAEVLGDIADDNRKVVEAQMQERLTRAYFTQLRTHHATVTRAWGKLEQELREEYADFLELATTEKQQKQEHGFYSLVSPKLNDFLSGAKGLREGRPTFVYFDLSMTTVDESQAQGSFDLCQPY
jgi:hypothetical protein